MSPSAADGRLRLAAWIGVALVALVPIALAVASPLQRGREVLYVVGGMAGVLAMSLLFVQPLLKAGAPRFVATAAGLRWHRIAGLAVIALVLVHVGALYAYSPEDVADALLLVSPTPFSVYGVTGLIGLLAMAILVAVRRRQSVAPRLWRVLHSLLAIAIVVSAAVHALMIEGTMEERSKLLLCVATLAAAIAATWVTTLAPALRRRRPAGR